LGINGGADLSVTAEKVGKYCGVRHTESGDKIKSSLGNSCSCHYSTWMASTRKDMPRSGDVPRLRMLAPEETDGGCPVRDADP
jgi:hypothetical protein